MKLAIAIVLCGGVSRTYENGSRVRGESHLLMIGDSGTDLCFLLYTSVEINISHYITSLIYKKITGCGKSQLLKYISKISTRGIYSTGIGSTHAGLTVAAVKVNYRCFFVVLHYI